MSNRRPLTIASNRLPIVLEENPASGQLRVVPGSGGLVTALGPVLKQNGGRWVGWLGPGSVDARPAEGLEQAGAKLGCELYPVALSAEEAAGYYGGFSNEVLWPLFHDFIGHCNFDPAYWPLYQSANRRFAELIAKVSGSDDYIWIHDYQLMLVGGQLRSLGIDRELGYFLHIPFPPLDVFEKMPWRTQILEGLLQYDLIGFQTPRDVRNFLQCVRHRVEGSRIEERGSIVRVSLPGRTVCVGHFPISIDYNDFLTRSVENEVSEIVARLRSQLPGRQLILGLDRLDYSKGIIERVRAFGNALERYPELRERTTFIQVVVPSRTRVDDYKTLKDEIERLISVVNGRYTRAGWTPIQYIFRRLEWAELLAYYRASDVALVTPLKDGMNLVSKEYCACSLEHRGVLILSEFAGAASQLSDGSLIVNPFDIEQTADAIYSAATMHDEERRSRMQKLRELVQHHDIYRWVDAFFDAAKLARTPAAA